MQREEKNIVVNVHRIYIGHHGFILAFLKWKVDKWNFSTAESRSILPPPPLSNSEQGFDKSQKGLERSGNLMVTFPVFD